jgi:hypothetical protein
MRSSKGTERSCLTFKRFRSKALSSVPAGSVMAIYCNIAVKRLGGLEAQSLCPRPPLEGKAGVSYGGKMDILAERGWR